MFRWLSAIRRNAKELRGELNRITGVQASITGGGITLAPPKEEPSRLHIPTPQETDEINKHKTMYELTAEAKEQLRLAILGSAGISPNLQWPYFIMMVYYRYRLVIVFTIAAWLLTFLAVLI
jgi:hypothetical protein